MIELMDKGDGPLTVLHCKSKIGIYHMFTGGQFECTVDSRYNFVGTYTQLLNHLKSIKWSDSANSRSRNGLMKDTSMYCKRFGILK